MENTPLSPKAKAVSDAAADVYWDWCDMSTASSSVIAAATLRAAVKACAFEDFNNRLLLAADLLTIADELEAL